MMRLSKYLQVVLQKRKYKSALMSYYYPWNNSPHVLYSYSMKGQVLAIENYMIQSHSNHSDKITKSNL